MLLTFSLAEIKVLFGGSDLRPTVERAHRLQDEIFPQKMHDLRKQTCSAHIDAFRHGGFRSILQWHDQRLPVPASSFHGNR
jgi:hypothetical protein